MVFDNNTRIVLRLGLLPKVARPSFTDNTPTEPPVAGLSAIFLDYGKLYEQF
ncbi:hypothetical protein [Cylindrospermum sp. FACHB-282]|uniref:hypothetical protein n=1 Tax=Cylindrospermum sp. FACHB-282 TaxID=2692794 RepID=UPI001688339B|nr:hypothetical protein [Cylindrospermum sp. FACHB-282]MBD2387985.1 hypothetical protein [Cylindrospermum sp. FACHB-282]